MRFGIRIEAFLGRFLCQLATFVVVVVVVVVVVGEITVRIRVGIEASFLGIGFVTTPRLDISVVPRVVGLARLLKNERKAELVS
jgi:hypothetical protein